MPATSLRSVDTEKRDKLLADREAEFIAAKEAIKIRYEDEAQKENANVKALTEEQMKELTELRDGYELFKTQSSLLEKLLL